MLLRLLCGYWITFLVGLVFATITDQEIDLRDSYCSGACRAAWVVVLSVYVKDRTPPQHVGLIRHVGRVLAGILDTIAEIECACSESLTIGGVVSPLGLIPPWAGGMRDTASGDRRVTVDCGNRSDRSRHA